MMPLIEPLRVGPVQASHPTAQVGLWSFHHQVVVIGYQAIHLTTPVLLPDFASQQPEKLLAIGFIEKDGLRHIATRRQVVERIGRFQPKRSSHRIWTITHDRV
jgi:hypothetical protein